MSELSEQRTSPALLTDADIWNLDHALARILGDAVRRLREMDHGHPGTITMEKWRETLDEMAGGFQQYADAEDRDEDPDYDRLNRSLDLLRLWFAHLWD